MDIQVIMSDMTQVVSQEGFGKVLIVSTTADAAYKEYDVSENLTAFNTDWSAAPEVCKIAETYVAQKPRPMKVATFGKNLSTSLDKATDLTTSLNTLIGEHNNWYRLMLEDKTETLIAAVSTWCETNDKMFYTVFDNTTFTTDFSNKKKTVLNYKSNDERLDAAMVGYAATRVPGSFTFKFKPLTNITTDSLTVNDLTTIRSKNMNAYITKFENIGLGTAQLDSGKTASGDYIDHIESMDWIKYRVQGEVGTLLMTSDKVPYTNTGIQSVVAAVTTALQQAYDNGIIGTNQDNTPAFVVNFKTLAQIPDDDRKARRLTGISFKYVEAGAIEEVTINGAVVLEL